MKKRFYYRNHLVEDLLVVGLGVSNEAAIKYLVSNYKIDFCVYDQKQLDSNYKHYNNFSDISLGKYDLILVTPGIPVNKHPYSRLSNYWDKVVGDIELFCNEIEKYPLNMAKTHQKY
jgi:UDP-N-acetylmuramoylalanine--D-glutamate ligase